MMGLWVAIFTGWLRFMHQRRVSGIRSRYGLGELALLGNEPVHITRHHPRWFELRLVSGSSLGRSGGEIIANVEPVADYSRISTELSTTRGIALTSECVIDACSLQAGIDPDDLVTDLCLLLSVAPGTRVQWLYRRGKSPT
jgi:hypothetical protein